METSLGCKITIPSTTINNTTICHAVTDEQNASSISFNNGKRLQSQGL